MTDAAVARAAKDSLRRKLRRNSHVVGIGLTVRNGKYVIKVNLSQPDDSVPSEEGPVEVVREVVGAIRAS